MIFYQFIGLKNYFLVLVVDMWLVEQIQIFLNISKFSIIT